MCSPPPREKRCSLESGYQTDVLIIGAGPTGLSLACQLARYGVDFIIVEKNDTVTPYSKAIGVQARTLEIYDQIDLAKEAIEQGTIAGKGRLLIHGKVRGEIDFSHIGEGLSPYPFVLMLEQSKNEKLLYEYLQNHGKKVLWKTKLQRFSQNKSLIKAELKIDRGRSQNIEAQYLVGCDGPQSQVRHGLELDFSGGTFDRMFYVADAQIDWEFPHDALHICLANESFAVFFPLKGEKRYRIVGAFPQEFAKDEGDVLYEEVETRIKQQSKLDLDIHDVEWFSTYRVHTRHASKFYKGKCFLAGDSAHIHSPAGAQGMNTGIQDGYNLAWKLALVSKRKASERLLDTYNEERLENARHLLRSTDRIFEVAGGEKWFFAFLRTKVLPTVAKYILNLDSVKSFLFPIISQTGINYRRSSLSHHAGDKDFKIKAGDRMPYISIKGRSIYDCLDAPKFHLLVFSTDQDSSDALKRVRHGVWAEMIDFHAFQIEPRVEEIFGTTHPFFVFLRPDGHIGFISPSVCSFEVDGYLNQCGITMVEN